MVKVVWNLIKEFSYDLGARGQGGMTLLHIACLKGALSLAKTLILKHKADIYIHDEDMNTPLHVAALCGRDDRAVKLQD